MEVLRPDEVRERYGPLFCRGFYTMVDEKSGKARIVEKCVAKGPGEWDVVNRRRTGGVIESVRLESDSVVMDVVIGERELSFGPVSADVGGQGLSALRVEGDEVRTTWSGIAGASVGVGACIPQCPDVIRTEYPDGFMLGGAHRATVDIITPKMVRVIVGIDDTDTKDEGASWVVGLRLGTTCPVGKFLEHKIIQLNPKVPNKTTNCCSTAVSFAVRESEIPALIEYAVDFVRGESYSDDAVLTVFQGLEVPERLRDFGWSCKSVIYGTEDAVKVAEECGVQIISLTGMKGVIGAVAAIGCFDLGERSAGIPEDFERHGPEGFGHRPRLRGLRRPAGEGGPRRRHAGAHRHHHGRQQEVRPGGPGRGAAGRPPPGPREARGGPPLVHGPRHQGAHGVRLLDGELQARRGRGRLPHGDARRVPLPVRRRQGRPRA